MDGFQFNKYAGAALATALGIVVLGQFVGPTLVKETYPKEPAYELPMLEEAASGGGEEKKVIDLGTLLAAASPDQGAVIANKCKSCHSLVKGGPNMTGPGLWGVIGATPGVHPGFAYSAAMKAAAGRPWDFAHMDEFLANPRGSVPGTAMSFAGLKKPEERAALLVYLRTLTDGAPLPLPAPVAPPPAAEGGEVPAEGAAPPAEGAAPATVPAAPQPAG
jgi:cytochrome c